jgi:amino acid transporter
LIGGIALLLLGLVYAELGAAFPRAGGLVRYPLYSHGPLVGYLMSFITVIAFSSIVGIEVLAVRQYATSWWPALSQPDGQAPTVLGWFVQFGLLIVFLLNYWSVRILIGPLSFVVASLILYWAGWQTLSWLLGVQLLLFVVTLVLSYLGSFDGISLLKSPWDQILVALVSVGIYYWGGLTGLAQPIVDEDEVEEEETAEAVTER